MTSRRTCPLLSILYLTLLFGSAASLGAAESWVAREFHKYDRNGDGQVLAAEMNKPRLFGFLDTNRDGRLTLEEAETRLNVRKPAAPTTVSKPIIVENKTPRDPDTFRQGPKALLPAEYLIGRMIPDLAFTDVNGKPGKLSDYRTRKGLVVALTNTTCPLCKKYGATLARLEKTLARQDMALLLLNLSEVDDAATIRASIKSYGFTSRYVHDPDGTLAKALKARTTTDVFVLDAARTLVYRGAVDDQYGFAYAKEAPTRNYLLDAVQAVAAGQAPAVAATWAPGCVLAMDAPPPVASTITWHNRVSRIVSRSCMACHRTGGVGPFPLTTYDEVKGHRGMIKYVLEDGIMPPWHAEPGSGPWANDTSLAADEKSDLLAWLKGGMPEGDARDAAVTRRYPTEWQIGKPDVVLNLPKEVAVKAEGTMPYVNLKVKTDFAEDRWVQAVEIRPTAPQAVHHVLVYAAAPWWTLLKPQDGEGNIHGDKKGLASRFGGFFAAYVPGNSYRRYPEGLAKKLPAGATLHFQMHYTPFGKPTSDRTQLAIVFAKEPPRHEVMNVGVTDRWLSIPPGAANHTEHAQLKVENDVQVLSFMPHMHTRGKSIHYEVQEPAGARKTLLKIPRYDFNWQLSYTFAQPYFVPSGSVVHVTGVFDNSADNPANPDPTKWVHWGQQTKDEMLIGYLEYYVQD